MESQISQKQFSSPQNIHLGAWRNHPPEEIMLLLGNVNYTEVFFVNGKKLIVATTLKKLEARFEICGSFFRTHKSFLVNLNYIKKSDSVGGDEFVEMQNDFRVAVSRRRKVAFEKRLNEFN
jgi:DNA-binding LytR/AlgR family response regulator